MTGYYPYLVASLPALSFGVKPPVSFTRFLELCGGFLSESELAVLGSLRAPEPASCLLARNATLRQWLSFETMVRNELVTIRAARQHVDPARYLRAGTCPASSHAAHIAINAYRKTSPRDVAESLDRERWDYLDELALGHYFDLDTLIIYGVRLLILERWERVRGAEAERLLEETLQAARREEDEHKES